MSDVDKSFSSAVAAFYETYMVPMIFDGYAEDLAEKVAAAAPSAVLETAAGTGVVTRALAPRLEAGARYVVTDLNPPMLEEARRRQGGAGGIEWLPADALALPFPDGDFDAVCCQFGAMFFPDRVAGYAEARRVLRPGGRFVFNIWDDIGQNEFADEVTKAVGAMIPEDPPRFLARTPHGHGDRAVIESELREAGFSSVEIETIAKRSPAPDPRFPAVAYCQGTPLRNEIEARQPDGLEEATDRAAAAIRARFGDGAIAGKIQAHVIVATR